ncbi:phosphopantetheine-binding protein [Actinoplanes sp. NPDC049802]|uniref:acyl carrier protein n=1 Tax=Actinoplanes sp. NPDC049802 TaxID=3154742 RepID=UPI0033DCE134
MINASVLSCEAIERELRDVWGNLFGTTVGPHDNFFALGGDSLKVVEAVMGARRRGIDFRSSAVFRNPTPARLAEHLTVGGGLREPARAPAVPAVLRGDATAPMTDSDDSAASLHVIHSVTFREAERQAVARWAPGRTIASWSAGPVGEVADRYAGALTGDGPGLIGFGDGAVIALEVARLRAARSLPVGPLVLVLPPRPAEPVTEEQALGAFLDGLARRFGLTGEEDLGEVHARVRAAGWFSADVTPADLPAAARTAAAVTAATSGHRPGAYGGRAVVVHDGADRDTDGWATLSATTENHWFDYGLANPLPLLADDRLAEIMGKELSR